MKNIITSLSIALFTLLAFTSCEKLDTQAGRPYGFGNKGNIPELRTSVTSTQTTAADSSATVVGLSWTNPAYATDSNTVKYVIEIDSADRDFSGAIVAKTVIGKTNATLSGKELNNILLGLGFSFNTRYLIDVRVTSSYGNNNEAYRSNTVKISTSAYRVPPKVTVPAALYIVGNLNGWNNNPGLDTKYQFDKIDETTYAGVFEFTSGGNYKLIQQLGNWGTQFHMLSGGTATAGSFEQRDADPAFINPSAPGWYRVTIDFQNGTFKVVPTNAARVPKPANLYIVGNLNGWNNSASLDPIYKFTSSGPFTYTCNVNFTSGGNYKLIQQLGNWGTQFHMLSGGTAFAGEFEQRDADPAFINPDMPGNYKVTVNFATCQFSVKKI
jgi:starch-binding outer membrane protein SusE/F